MTEREGVTLLTEIGVEVVAWCGSHWQALVVCAGVIIYFGVTLTDPANNSEHEMRRGKTKRRGIKTANP